jgi:hypothetical protein
MNTATLPTLNDLGPEVARTLATLDLLVTGAQKLATIDELSKEKTLVVDNSLGTRQKRIETVLREAGLVVVVEPVVNWKVRDQSGGVSIYDAQLSVAIRVNPEVNYVAGSKGGTGLNPLSVASEVIKALCASRTRHPGSEFFRHEGGALTQFDPGLMTYDIVFVKEMTIL